MEKTEANQELSKSKDTTEKVAKKEWKIPSFQQIRSQDTHSLKNINQINGLEVFACYGSAS